MEKKAYSYKLTIEGQTDPHGEPFGSEPLELTFTNHDDIFKIIEMAKSKNQFDDPAVSTQFVLGLKMFGEIMLNDRKNPLFEDLIPAWGEFMKKLKGKKPE